MYFSAITVTVIHNDIKTLFVIYDINFIIYLLFHIYLFIPNGDCKNRFSFSEPTVKI